MCGYEWATLILEVLGRENQIPVGFNDSLGNYQAPR